MQNLKRCALILTCVAATAIDLPRAMGQEAPGAAAGSEAPVSPLSTRPTATRITVNFKDASIDAVLDYLSQEAGFIIVKIAPVGTRVTVYSAQPVTPEEAVRMLNSELKASGYTAIQMGRVLKITSLDKAKKENIPVHFGSDPAQIEQSDELITQVIPVRSVDAVKLKTDLQPLISTDADFAANAASNSLIMTDTSANIHRVVEIVASLDKREASASTITVRQLKYADATAAAKLVTDIFNPQTQQQNSPFPFGPGAFFQGFRGGGGGGGGAGGGGGGRFGGGGGGPGGAAAQQQQDQGQTGHVLASADTRTNTVVVSGPPDTLLIIGDMLDKLDADPASEQTFFIYKVKNGQAIDMQTTLNSLFSGTSTSSNTNTQNRNLANNTTTANRNTGGSTFGGGGFGGGGGGGFGGGGGGAFGGSFGGGGGGGGFGGGQGTNGQYRPGTTAGATGARPAIPGFGTGAAGTPGGISDLIGQVYVVADQDTNSLLVATATKFEQRIRDVIKELDRPVPQVLIKTLIAEVTHDNSQDLGIDFSGIDLSTGGRGAKFSSTLGAAAAAASTTAPPGLVVNVLAKDVNATIQALAQTSKLDVLSRPYILTSDNQQADITVGSEVPLVTSSYIDTNGLTHNNTTYEDIGVILTVTPHINPEGVVMMDVAPQVSALSAQTVNISPGVDLPIIELRSADAYVAVKDGQTIVIGGLMQNQTTSSTNKIPFLGDIPIVGKLFQYNSDDKKRTELLIFLTPHVAMAPENLVKMSEDEVKGLKLTPSAVQPGTMQDEMRGMARGSATQPSQPLQLPTPQPQRTNPFDAKLPGGS